MQNIVAKWEYRLQQKGVTYDFEIPYTIRKGLFCDIFSILCSNVGIHLAFPVQLFENGSMVIQGVYLVCCIIVYNTLAGHSY